MYYLFSFRSRAESMAFFDSTKKSGIASRLVSTPREISIGCGLSVKIGDVDFNVANNLLEVCQAATFLGVFSDSTGSYNRVNYKL